MSNRVEDLIKLQEFIDNVDKETTLLLQNLQWDHKHLLESPPMVSCKYVAEHRMPLQSLEAHEKQCHLRQEGYSKTDVLLPDPINPHADTVVKLTKQDIMDAINAAASFDPLFKRGAGSGAVEPLTAERLQAAYSADERRAIHDAVVAAAPACHDLTELALASSSGPRSSKEKSRAEILAELRDMKRRRARYRVAARTTNYSDALRDVINTQMELYAEANGIFIKTEYGTKTYVSLNKSTESNNDVTNIVIKQERTSPDTDSYYRHKDRSRSSDRKRQRNEYQDRKTMSKRSRDQYDDDNSSDKRKYKDFNQDKYSKERQSNDDKHSKQETYYRSKDTSQNERRNRHDSRRKESTTSKHVGKSNDYETKERHGNYNDSTKMTSKHTTYESRTKEYDHYRSHRIKEENRRKYDDYHIDYKYSNKSREDKSRRHND